MASLDFIMDVNDDRQTADSRHPHNKRDKGASKPASAGQLQEPPTNQQADPGSASSPGQATEGDINQAALAAQPKRRGAPSRGLKSAPPASGREGAATAAAAGSGGAGPIPAVSSSSSSSPTLSASTNRPSASRQSTTSSDSMDPTAYGSSASSPSTARGPQRPMPMHLSAAPFQPRLTPKTNRVSKAQKGLPVHVCEICKPPRTFTRAEHLRRHQLSHGAPQFQCPSCEKQFHREDLLARHQQKHENVDQVPRSGTSPESPHASSAPVVQQAPQPHGSSSSITGPAPSPSTTELPPTPSTATIRNQSGFPQLGSPAHGNSSSYASVRGSPGEYHSPYTLSPEISVITPTHAPSLASPYHGGSGSYQTPRSGHPPIYVVTQGLQPRGLQPPGLQPPGLQPPEQLPEHDTSPWPSSASDSTYSTPSDVSRTRPWIRGPSPTTEWATSQTLPPYPSTRSRGLRPPGAGMDGVSALQAPFLINSYTSNPPAQEQHFGSTVLNVQSMGFAEATSHHGSVSNSTVSTFRPHQQRQDNSISSLRGQTPPMNAASHASESLVAPVPTLPSRLDPLASLDRRKGIMMEAHQDLMGTSMGDMSLLGGLDAGYGGDGANAANLRVDDGSHSAGIAAELDLAMGGGCVMPIPPTMTIPLPAPVRAAVPRYLQVYWARIDKFLPMVHRQTFEAAPEDALMYAMAAVATQHLDSREDRARGNQLHEFAWQEVKRTPQWTMQIMQAILLCEYFARFRGRKAVTRPSKPFESLYSRVLYHSPALLDHAMLASNQQLPLQDRWRNWVDAESRRRLFAGCLFCDGHAAVYQQQRRAQDFEADGSAALHLVPLLGRSAKLWEARTAEEWEAALAEDPGAVDPEFVPPLEQLTEVDLFSRRNFDRLMILSACALRLPRRHRSLLATAASADNSPAPDDNMDNMGSQFDQLPEPQQQPPITPHMPYIDAEERISYLFGGCPVGNSYLALQHTPLRDLLAVAGDSWVFTQKLLHGSTFVKHQRRVRLWATGATTSPSLTTSNTTGGTAGTYTDPSLAGLNPVRATVYAARAILLFLEREQPLSPYHGPPAALWCLDLADYWAMYVCALICWAFSHRARGTISASSSSSTSFSPSSSDKQQQRQARQRSSSAASGSTSASVSEAGSNNSPPLGITAAVTTSSGGSRSTADQEAAAIEWLRTVAAEGATLDDVVAVRGAPEAHNVVCLVRRRLESDCVGERSRLYWDAVGVLKKVEEGVGRMWF